MCLPGEFVVGGQLSKEALMEFGIISSVAEDDSFSIVRWGEDDGKRETTIPPHRESDGRKMKENFCDFSVKQKKLSFCFRLSLSLDRILCLRCFC